MLLKYLYKTLQIQFILSLSRNAMTGKKFVVDWPWELRMITWVKSQRQNQDANQVYRPDCKKVLTTNHLFQSFDA